MTIRTHTADPKVRRLGEVALFQHCSDRELAHIAAACDELTVPAGTVLARQGHLARDCLVVHDGVASVEVDGEVRGTVGPGEAIGEMALVTHTARSATVVASTEMTVFVIDSRRFDSVIHERADIAITMLRCAAARLQHVYEITGRHAAR